MNQKFNLKTNNFIKNMLRYSYLIIMALLLNAVVNEIIVSANKIISVNIDYMLSGEAVDIGSIIEKFISDIIRLCTFICWKQAFA